MNLCKRQENLQILLKYCIIYIKREKDMEYIIHLTEKCNLNCTYCYENKRNKDISLEDIQNLIDCEIDRKQKYSIIIFYGGEPLLQKNMIKSTIDYINSKNSLQPEFF